jgi:hypothetical protein
MADTSSPGNSREAVASRLRELVEKLSKLPGDPATVRAMPLRRPPDPILKAYVGCLSVLTDDELHQFDRIIEKISGLS